MPWPGLIFTLGIGTREVRASTSSEPEHHGSRTMQDVCTGKHTLKSLSGWKALARHPLLRLTVSDLDLQPAVKRPGAGAAGSLTRRQMCPAPISCATRSVQCGTFSAR